jgi:Flp pilus assembly protein TadD
MADAYLRAVRLDRDHVEAHRKLGVALARLGRHAEAIGPYQQAVLLAPLDSEVRFELGMCYVALANVRAATTQVEALQRLDPSRARELERAALAASRRG